MANYYLDQEFIEGFKKPIKWLPTIGSFNKPYHSIQLISIGVVSEDGRTYYAVSREFKPNDANDWVKENVLRPMFTELYQKESTYAKTYFPNSLTDKRLLKWRGKSNKQIAEEICDFIDARYVDDKNPSKGYIYPAEKKLGDTKQVYTTDVKFFGYFSDYDWTLFCSLFGTMMQLPNGFPKYCIDLKQTLDEKDAFYKNDKPSMTGISQAIKVAGGIENLKDYPKQENEHNALADARWNFELHKFLQTL